MLSRRHLLASGIATSLGAFALGLGQRLPASEPPGRTSQEGERSEVDRQAVGDLRQRGSAWLNAQQQTDGRLVPGDRFAVGVTALGALALAAPGADRAAQLTVDRALGFIRSWRQPDGGFYDPREGHALYGTALVLQLFAATGAGGTAELAGARDFLFGKHELHGDDQGAGFAADATGVPDLHATTAAIDGLVAGGVDPQDPHLRAALRFVAGCQDLSSNSSRPWATGSGGAVYSPDTRIVAGDHDQSGASSPAQPVAYGAMTHALIADLLVLGVTADDPRVTAALGWVGRTWTVERHPGRPEGRGQEGLFGYFAAVAKCCHLLGVERLPGDVDWRAALAGALRDRAQVQRVAGGAEGVVWRNAADRWGEALPQLSTSYALRTLAWIDEA